MIQRTNQQATTEFHQHQHAHTPNTTSRQMFIPVVMAYVPDYKGEFVMYTKVPFTNKTNYAEFV